MLYRAPALGRLIAFNLAIMAMVLQVSTTMLYGQGQTLSQTHDVETGLLTMVVCSPSGLKQITIDASGKIVDEKIPSDNTIDCPFSTALTTNNLLTPPQPPILPPSSKGGAIKYRSFGIKQLTAVSFLAVPARSPPFFSLI